METERKYYRRNVIVKCWWKLHGRRRCRAKLLISFSHCDWNLKTNKVIHSIFFSRWNVITDAVNDYQVLYSVLKHFPQGWLGMSFSEKQKIITFKLLKNKRVFVKATALFCFCFVWRNNRWRFFFICFTTYQHCRV